MGKSVLINRNGAFGDTIMMSHLPRLLKDNGYDFVGVSTGWKGMRILLNNPFIDKFHYFEVGRQDVSVEYYNTRVSIISEQYDHVVDLLHTLEVGALALEYQNEYYQSQKVREARGHENYYDIATIRAGYPELCGKYRGEVFYTDKEIATVEHDLLRPGRFRDKFKVMINISGSGPHKVFVNMKEVAGHILSNYPDAVIFTTGDSTVKELDLSGPRIHSIVGKKGFRQALLMAKYMDCMIGYESGIMCGASMWDVPTIQLMTCASIHNHCKYATRDYSLQSPARCSPCYKGPYKYYGCPKRNNLPICVYFDVKKITDQIDKVYELEYLKSKKASA